MELLLELHSKFFDSLPKDNDDLRIEAIVPVVGLIKSYLEGGDGASFFDSKLTVDRVGYYCRISSSKPLYQEALSLLRALLESLDGLKDWTFTKVEKSVSPKPRPLARTPARPAGSASRVFANLEMVSLKGFSHPMVGKDPQGVDGLSEFGRLAMERARRDLSSILPPTFPRSPSEFHTFYKLPALAA